MSSLPYRLLLQPASCGMVLLIFGTVASLISFVIYAWGTYVFLIYANLVIEVWQITPDRTSIYPVHAPFALCALQIFKSAFSVNESCSGGASHAISHDRSRPARHHTLLAPPITARCVADLIWVWRGR